MTDRYETLAARIDERFGEQVNRITSICGELTYEVDKDDLHAIATALPRCSANLWWSHSNS